MKRIEKVLDMLNIPSYDWYKQENSNDWNGFVEFWTDTAGQDIPVEITFDGTAEDFVKEFTEYAENYDVDEEVELYVDGRGKRGVPSTVRELLDDCQEAKDTLMKIADRLQIAIGLKEDTKKYRLHARVTKEIELTQDQAERLRNYVNGCIEHAEIDDIKEMFTADSTMEDGYELGYIPFEWICNDLQIGVFEYDDPCRCEDIELD